MSLPQDPTRLSPHIGTSRSPRSPPSPHFDDPPVVPPDEPPDGTGDRALFDDDDDDDEDIPYPEPGSEQTLLPPPNFNPFFTLIEDSTSGEHYHPYVHYVFADDDPVITTAAAMRSLGVDETHYLPQSTPERDPQSEEEAREDDDEAREPQVESPLPPPIPGAKERYLIVDLAADGHTIVDAQSLSPDWQITNTQVRTAPSFDEASPEQGYMLRIEGVEVSSNSKGKTKGAPGDHKLQEARDKAGGDIFGALDGLVKGIEGSLDVAGKITCAREDVRESDRTVLVVTAAQDEDKGKRRLSQA